MIRVLHVIGAMDRAGAETLLMNLYRNIDRDEVQFDFMVHAEGPCDYDEEIERLGGRIFHVPRYNLLNKKEYAQAVRTILREHPEDVIVHSHIGSAAPVHLAIARDEGRFAIAHSHNNEIPSLESALFKVIAYPVRWNADFYMACSPEAGMDRFGKKIVGSDVYSVLYNGIETNRYERNAEIVRTIKQKLGLDEVPVFGHIGRLTHQKNQAFLLEVFTRIRKALPEARLLLIGRGEDEEMLRETAEHLGIAEAVSLLGVRDDIPDLLRAMDVFVFPSRFEGLGVAIIEAQAAGLQCVASDEIHDIAIVSDRLVRLPLGDAQQWADECIAAYERSRAATDDRIDAVMDAGFDIGRTAERLQDFYLSHAPQGVSPGRA